MKMEMEVDMDMECFFSSNNWIRHGFFLPSRSDTTIYFLRPSESGPHRYDGLATYTMTYDIHHTRQWRRQRRH